MKRKHLLLAGSISLLLSAGQMARASDLADLSEASPIPETTSYSSSLLNPQNSSAATPAASDTSTPLNSGGENLTGILKDPSVVAADPSGQSTQNAQSSAQQNISLMDDANSGPNIHGFAAATLATDYITPRGLVVVDKGAVLQPIVGLVFPIGDIGPLKNFTVVGGLWNCITWIQNNPTVGPWQEMDDFFSVSFDLTDQLNATLTYVAFNSPTGAYVTEHNADLKLVYNDSSFWGNNFSINPYVDVWWAMAGGSTVVLGKPGETGYLEIGVDPSFTWNAIADYPITFKFPTYISVGPKDYWAYNGSPATGTWGGGNVGVFSASATASVPLAFMGTKYGYWHFDVGLTYFDLINTSLLDAGTIVAGNTRRDLFMGYTTIGVKF